MGQSVWSNGRRSFVEHVQLGRTIKWAPSISIKCSQTRTKKFQPKNSCWANFRMFPGSTVGTEAVLTYEAWSMAYLRPESPGPWPRRSFSYHRRAQNAIHDKMHRQPDPSHSLHLQPKLHPCFGSFLLRFESTCAYDFPPYA